MTAPDWLSGGVVENDAQEARSARDRPLPEHLGRADVERHDGIDDDVDMREAT